MPEQYKNPKRPIALFFLGIALSTITYVVPCAAANADKDELARGHFRQGVTYYQKGQFANALNEFKKAYQLRPSYKILFNIGQTHLELDHAADALNAFEGYLKAGQSAISQKRRAAVEREISRLLKIVGELVVVGQTGAQCWVDGNRIGYLPLNSPIRLSTGVHHIAVHLHEGGVCEKEVAIIGGKRRIEHCTRTDESEGPPEPESTWDAMASTSFGEVDLGDSQHIQLDSPEPSIKFIRVAPWIAAGMGVVTLTTGIVFAVKTSQLNAQLNGACDQGMCSPSYEDDINKLPKYAAATDAMFISTAVLATTATILFIVSKRKKRRTSEKLTPADDFALLHISQRFQEAR